MANLEKSSAKTTRRSTTNKSDIIKESDLITLLKGSNISYLKTRSLANRPDIVLDSTEKEFVEFLKVNGAQQVFVLYKYYDMEDMLINSTLINEKENVEIPLDILKKAVNKYNNMVKKLDFDNPKSITMMAIIDNREVAISRANSWLEKDKRVYSSGDQAFYSILDDISVELTGMTQDEIVDKQIIDEYKQKDELRRQFYEYIVHDNKFLRCANVQLRYNYANEIFNRASEFQFLYEFVDSDGEYKIHDLVTFLNMVWRLKKQGVSSYDAIRKYL